MSAMVNAKKNTHQVIYGTNKIDYDRIILDKVY